MNGFNRVVLMGNLTRDPQVRKIPTGSVVADMGLASNEVFRGQDGKTVERTCFVDVVAWRRQAETCGQYLAKGSRILVEGRLQLDQWQSQNGEKRSRLRVKADRVQFLGKPQSRGAEAAREPRVAAARQEDGAGREHKAGDGIPF